MTTIFPFSVLIIRSFYPVQKSLDFRDSLLETRTRLGTETETEKTRDFSRLGTRDSGLETGSPGAYIGSPAAYIGTVLNGVMMFWRESGR